MKRRLRMQRGLTTVIIALLLVSINVSGSAYVSTLEVSTTIVLYESPVDGEVLQVGAWKMIDIDVQPPFPGLFNSLFFHWEVIDWGNASNELTFYYEILEMNSTEFGLLNETSRLDMVSSRLISYDGSWRLGRGHNIEEAYGAYVCVLKIVSIADPTENSYMNATLLVEQSGI